MRGLGAPLKCVHTVHFTQRFKGLDTQLGVFSVLNLINELVNDVVLEVSKLLDDGTVRTVDQTR